MTMTDDEGNIITEKDAIKAGLAISQIDVSEFEDSDFKRGMEALQKLIFHKRVR